jgi:hypothetical protein
VCTVLLRFLPGERWPVLAGAVRDEFVDRAWDPPGRHWAGPGSPWARSLVGGRDRAAGGTWLAVDPRPGRPALAALLNGPPLPPLPDRARPTRGTLALSLLTTGKPPEEGALADYDTFHLLLAAPDRAELWSWDGRSLDHRRLPPGDHIVVNHGLDTDVDPVVPHFRPLLARTPSPDPQPGPRPAAAWDGWLDLLAGDGLAMDDPRALIVRLPVGDRIYGSTSVSLVALSAAAVRYDFTADPRQLSSWYEVDA